MAVAGREHELSPADVEAVLARQGFGTERPRSGAVILALPDPSRIIWANKAATVLFETDDPDELHAQVFAGRGREGLGASIDRLVPDGAPRLERLRLIRGFRSHTLIVQVGLTRLPDERPVIVLAMPGPEGARTAPEQFTAPGLAAPRPPEQAIVAEAEVGPGGVTEAGSALPEEVLPAESAAPAEQPEVVEDTAEAALRQIRERLSAERPTRLLWQTDAAHRLLKRTGGLAELAGPDDSPFRGRTLVEALRSAAATDELAAALASGAPWSGLHLRWPLAGFPASAAVTLGAVPILDRAGQLEGFRGFGIVDSGDLQPVTAEAEAPLLPGEAAPGPSNPVSREEVALDMEPVSLAVPPAAEEVATADLRPAPDPQQRPGAGEDAASAPAAKGRSESPVAFTSKVVSLRPYQTFAASAALIAASPRAEATSAPPPSAAEPPAETQDAETQDAPSPDTSDLTSSERFNFDEIGRALLRSGEPVRAAAPSDRTLAEANATGVLAALGLAVLVVSQNRFVYANRSFFELTGYPTLAAVEAAGGLSHLLGGLDAGVALGSTEDRAFPLIGAGGGVIPMEGRSRAVTWDDAPANLLTMRPATDRIAQVQMLEGEIKRRDLDLLELRAMLDRVSDSIVTVDRQGRVLTLSGAAERLFEFSVAEAAGEPLAMLVGPDAQIAVNAGDSAAELGKTGLDVTGRTASGKGLSLRMTWLSLSHGRSCVILRDQQERSSLQRDLASAQERLDQALAGRPEFLAKISHEIRTPMNAILGFAEVMLEERFGPVGNERYHSYLRDIHASGAQVLDLVNDLLDLSRMDAGPMDMHPAPLDVNRVIGECVGEMQAVANRERVIMRLSLLPHLAAALIDEHAFRQIIGHILSNAIRFNEPGGQVIVSTAMNEAGAVAVRVRDTGIGMTESEVASAMEPFRISRTVQAGGNGLGLPLARALIEASGATMSIRSQKNEGTLVEILLPSSPAERMRVPAE